MAEHKKGAVAYYLIIALILGAITYVEFAIVEYQDAISWLNPFWTIATLVILSLVKFALVVAIYMHLRDDDPIYTGFFSSGMVMAMGTFVALSFLFTVRSVATFQSETVAEQHAEMGAEHADEGHDSQWLEPVKTLAQQSHVPAPKNQAALSVALPVAPVAEYSLRLPGLAMAAEMPAVNTETVLETPVITTEDVEIVAQAVSFDWQELGEKTYTTNCLACHQANGMGIPSAFPPLAGHMPEFYHAEGGREYIIDVVLYGLMGEIEVGGTKYNSVMTPWAAILSDEQVAATLNHELMSWGNDALIADFSPILPEEVAAQRGKSLSASDVLALRPVLP